MSAESAVKTYAGLISTEVLAGWLERLAQTATLIAPREVEGVLLFRRVQHAADIARLHGAVRPVLPLKEVFFPPTESLFTVEKIGKQVKITETLPEGPQVVFGVRPCDARGAKVMDALYLETPPSDPYYARRRENTTLIGLACQDLGETCFCTRLGGSPDDPRDVDLMLTEMGDGYGVQVITDKGQALLDGIGDDLIEIDAGQEGMETARYPGMVEEGLRSIDWPAHFSDNYWEEMSERCLSCRICAYVCPTCRCFAVRDEAVPGSNGNSRYERVRCWDSCAGVAYRRIAGGHNPRPEKSQRLRNRFFCKFDYYPQQYGPLACTGCGRCIDYCPVNIDITEVIDNLIGK
jgi:sulfhydrogenase subunit beta (sulfur reductase)